MVCFYNMLIRIFLQIAALHSLILAQDAAAILTRHRSITKQSLNKFADAVFRRLRENIRNRSVETITVPGMGPLGDGHFTGLNNIRRLGDADLLGPNRTVAMLASLGDSAQLTFPCRITFFGKNICQGGATLHFQDLQFYLAFREQSKDDGLPQLEICDISHLGRVTMRMGDDGGLSPILSRMGTLFSSLMKSRVASSLEDILCNAVASNI